MYRTDEIGTLLINLVKISLCSRESGRVDYGVSSNRKALGSNPIGSLAGIQSRYEVLDNVRFEIVLTQ